MLLRAREGAIEGDQAVVYMYGMRKNVWTDAARYRVGAELTVSAGSFDAMPRGVRETQRSQFENEQLEYEPTCWGEPVAAEATAAPGVAWYWLALLVLGTLVGPTSVLAAVRRGTRQAAGSSDE